MGTYIKDYCCCEKGNQGREKYKILLVYPKVGSEAKNVSLFIPLSLLYLASYLKEFSVAIFDQRVHGIEKFQKLLDQKPLCVGFSVMTGPQIKSSLALAEIVKEADILTVFGGVHISILPEQTQRDIRVDYVVVGEGELAFRKFIESLIDGKKIGPVISDKNTDLDISPSLPYELVDIEDYVYSAPLEGRTLPTTFSRGCPFECTFCCNPVITHKKWRTMDIDLATERLYQVVNKYNLDGVIFWDENLTVNPEVLNKLAKNINAKFEWFAQSRVNTLLKYDLNFLKKMGLSRLSCGIESGSPKILKKIKKQEQVEEYIEVNRRLAQTGINVWYNYIVGFPYEEVDDVAMTVRLAIRMLDENPNAVNSTFYLLVPYPGTEIAREFLKSDVLPDTFEGWSDFGRHNFNVGWHEPEMLNLYERICFSSKFVGRKMLEIFPDDEDVKVITKDMTDKWRNFDFFDDKEWKKTNNRGWEVLRKLFGEHAY